MNFLKGGNLIKLVAFFVIAAILTCTVAFASGGWQSFTEGPDSGDVTDNDSSDGDADENTDGSNQIQTPDIKPEPPVYKHYLTGLKVDAEVATLAPLAFVYSTADPLYGLSYSFLTVELPTENGGTRLLSLVSSSQYLGKIGSIAPTRAYISEIANKLGATLIHQGCDDSFEYSDKDYSNMLDLNTNTGYSYTEYTEFNYSNGDLISALLKNTGTNNVKSDSVIVPFVFSDTEIRGGVSATSVIIPYSDTNSTHMLYDATIGEYIYGKSTGAVKDLLNDKSCSYKNVFVLYANSTTYETAESIEAVINTEDGGLGYYFTNGSVIRISWSTDDGGNLLFLDEHGSRLTVNVGTSYIAFEKASRINNTTYN